MFSKLKAENYFLFELFAVVRVVAFMGPSIATNMLIQDKICLIHHNQTATFCQTVQLPSEQLPIQQMKDHVLTETGQFTNYKNFVETVPVLLWALFLGPFLDAYPNSTFIIFLIAIIGDCFAALSNLVFTLVFYNTSPYFLLLSSLSIWFSGGMMSFGSTAALYITRNFAEKSRALRFVVLEIMIVTGYASAVFIGGQFLRTKLVTTNSPQLRTYHLNYLFTLALSGLSFVLLFLLYRLDTAKKSKLPQTQLKQKEQSATTKSTSALAVFFNLDNIRQTLRAFFRPRPRNVRLQIFILCFLQFSQFLITLGLATLMVQFAQKVYHWDPTTYSTYSAIQQIAGMALLGLMSGIFITWLEFSDSNLILLAQISNFLADLIRGTFLSPLAFFISIPIGSLNGFGIISAKSKFSKIVPKGEAGKIFSLNSTIESLVPLGASLIYSNIFAYSIGFYPGLIYHFSCALMVLTVGAMIIEKRYCPVSCEADLEVDGEGENVCTI